MSMKNESPSLYLDFKDWLVIKEARTGGRHILWHASAERNIQNFRISWAKKAKEAKGAFFVANNYHDAIVYWGMFVLRGGGQFDPEGEPRDFIKNEVTIYKLSVPEELYQTMEQRQDVKARMWIEPEEMDQIEIIGRETFNITDFLHLWHNMKSRRAAVEPDKSIYRMWQPIPGRTPYKDQRADKLAQIPPRDLPPEGDI